jgi:hypothetical protein
VDQSTEKGLDTDQNHTRLLSNLMTPGVAKSWTHSDADYRRPTGNIDALTVRRARCCVWKFLQRAQRIRVRALHEVQVLLLRRGRCRRLLQVVRLHIVEHASAPTSRIRLAGAR